MTTAIVLLPQRCCATFEGKANFFWDRQNGIGLYAYIDAGNGLVVCPECGKVYQWDTESGGETEPGGEAMALTNVDFEGGFTERGAPEVTIANGWEPWHTEIALFGGVVKRPEWKPEQVGVGRGRVHSGVFAQKMFTTTALHRGGLFQRIPAVAGQWYRFSAWVWVWASAQDNPDSSVNGRLHARVGINPWGGGAYHYASVYGKEALQYDHWEQVEVIAQAWANEITVFVESMPEFPTAHNDTYWDDAAIEEIGEPGTEPEEPEEPVEPGTCLFDASEILSRIALAEETIMGRINRIKLNVEPE